MGRKMLLTIILLLVGCDIHPLTDEQIEAVKATCQEQGKTIEILNTTTVSRVYCE